VQKCLAKKTLKTSVKNIQQSVKKNCGLRSGLFFCVALCKQADWSAGCVVIDRLEESLRVNLPRLIQDELCRGLRRHASFVSEQIASRLDVRAKTPVNSLSTVVMPARPALSAALNAVQLLRSGQVNAAFELVIPVPVDFHFRYVCCTVN